MSPPRRRSPTTQDKLADQAQVEWIASAARAQANLTREVSKVYANTGRELLVK